MSLTRPGGTLLQLPHEIRDEIYSHYFSNCLVLKPYYHHNKHDEHILHNLAILRTSKAMSSDAKQFLYSKAASKAATFKYYFDFDLGATFSTPPTKEATECMKKVEFVVFINPDCLYKSLEPDVSDSVTPSPVSGMNPMCEATVDHFAGTAVMRDGFRITFQIDPATFEKCFSVFMKTRFFRTLKGFTGFQKLTVVLNNWFECGCSLDGLVLKANKGATEVQMELGPYLGSSIIKRSGYQLVDDHCFAIFTLELEFQPRQFHDEIFRAEAARLMEEADSLEG